MAEAAKDQDQSMEDILQSIKRIIAEEGELAPEATGSDVLELTDLLADDGSVSHTQPETRAVEAMSIDEIMAAPVSSIPDEVPAAVEPPAKRQEAAPTPPPAPAPAADDESLISGSTLSASVAALNALRDSLMPAPSAPRPAVTQFRSGTTVEDLVLESLKPMLKEWLDQNLASMVETLVQKEINRLAKK